METAQELRRSRIYASCMTCSFDAEIVVLGQVFVFT